MLAMTAAGPVLVAAGKDPLLRGTKAALGDGDGDNRAADAKQTRQTSSNAVIEIMARIILTSVSTYPNLVCVYVIATPSLCTTLLLLDVQRPEGRGYANELPFPAASGSSADSFLKFSWLI